MNVIPNKPLREAFEDSGMTAADLARAAGWLSRGRPDSSRIRRTLGLKKWHIRKKQRWPADGRPYFQKTVREATALHLAQALGISPRDVGL